MPKLIWHETCEEYFRRRLAEGWRCVRYSYPHVLLVSPEGIQREIDLRNDTLTIVPNADDSVHADWTKYPSSGVYYTKVDEGGGGNGDTDYIRTSANHALWREARFDFVNHTSESGIISAVRIYIRCRSEMAGAGAGDCRTIIRPTTTTYYGNIESPNTSYVLYSTQYAANPDGGSWDWTDIDGLAAGVYARSELRLSLYRPVRCTQVYIEVDYTPSGADVNLAGVSAGVATAGGDIIRTLVLAGLSDGVATVSGALGRVVPLAALSDGIATVSAFLRRNVPLSALSEGASTVAGAISRAIGIAGLSQGIATVSGFIRRNVPLSGLSQGIAAVSGMLRRVVPIAGLSEGIASVSGVLQKYVPLAAISQGIATVSGAITMNLSLAGISQGVATVTGAIKLNVALKGISNGIASVISALTVSGAGGWVSPTGHDDPDSQWTWEDRAYDEDTGNFAYVVNNEYWLELTLGSAISCDKVRIYCEQYTGDTSYDLDIKVDVYYSSDWHNIHDGIVTKNTWVELPIGSTQSVDKARVCTNTGVSASRRLKEFDFWEVGVGAVLLAGISQGIATVSGALKLNRALAGVSVGVTTVSGFLRREVPLSGLSSGVATVAGAIKLDVALSALSEGVASVSGFLRRNVNLAGISSGVASVAGILSTAGEILLAGISQGIATVSGAISMTLSISGISNGIATVSGTLGKYINLAAISAGVSTVGGAITRTIGLVGASAGIAAVSGNLSRLVGLIGSSAGVAIVSGAISRIVGLAGSSAGVATVVGNLIISLAGIIYQVVVASPSRIIDVAISARQFAISLASRAIKVKARRDQ